MKSIFHLFYLTNLNNQASTNFPKKTKNTLICVFSNENTQLNLKCSTGHCMAGNKGLARSRRRRNSVGNSRASHNLPSLFALPKRTSQTAKSGFFFEKEKSGHKPKGDVRNLVGSRRRRNSEGNSRASHNSPSLFALPKRTSQTAKSGFFFEKEKSGQASWRRPESGGQ